MSVSNVPSNVDPFQAYQLSSLSSPRQQSHTDFKKLFDSLKSGDLSSAQQAFSSLQQLLTSDIADIKTRYSDQRAGKNTFTADINALGKALKSGDLTTARTDLVQLQKDVQSAISKYRQQVSSSGTQNGIPNQVIFFNDLKSLGQAPTSDDLTTVQTGLAQLQKDTKQQQTYKKLHLQRGAVLISI